MGAVPTDRKIGRNTRSPSKPAPGPPTRRQSVKVLPCVYFLIAASKFKDGFEFLQVPKGTQHGLACAASLVHPQT